MLCQSQCASGFFLRETIRELKASSDPALVPHFEHSARVILPHEITTNKNDGTTQCERGKTKIWRFHCVKKMKPDYETMNDTTG